MTGVLASQPGRCGRAAQDALGVLRDESHDHSFAQLDNVTKF
jgi:hypothetical protein